MFLGLGILAICGFHVAVGVVLSAEEEARRDYHWARVKGRWWAGRVAKFVGLPIGAAVFLVGLWRRSQTRSSDRRRCRTRASDPARA